MIDNIRMDQCKREHPGLDYERYTVLEIIPHNHGEVIIQISNTYPVHFCVQYGGNGFYCNTYPEALGYCYHKGYLKTMAVKAVKWLK